MSNPAVRAGDDEDTTASRRDAEVLARGRARDHAPAPSRRVVLERRAGEPARADPAHHVELPAREGGPRGGPRRRHGGQAPPGASREDECLARRRAVRAVPARDVEAAAVGRGGRVVHRQGQVREAPPRLRPGENASTLEELAPTLRKPPTTAISPFTRAAATSARPSGADAAWPQAADWAAPAPGSAARSTAASASLRIRRKVLARSRVGWLSGVSSKSRAGRL